MLSDGAERYLFISMSRYGYDWLARPTVLVIGAMTLIVVGAAFVLNSRGTSFQEPATGRRPISDGPGAS